MVLSTFSYIRLDRRLENMLFHALKTPVMLSHDRRRKKAGCFIDVVHGKTRGRFHASPGSIPGRPCIGAVSYFVKVPDNAGRLSARRAFHGSRRRYSVFKVRPFRASAEAGPGAGRRSCGYFLQCHYNRFFCYVNKFLYYPKCIKW